MKSIEFGLFSWLQGITCMEDKDECFFIRLSKFSVYGRLLSIIGGKGCIIEIDTVQQSAAKWNQLFGAVV